MAEGSSKAENKVICRFFATSGCRDGDKCPFSHDRSSRGVLDSVCRFYLVGKCIYGSSCRYSHIKPANIPSPSTSNPKEKLHANTVKYNNADVTGTRGSNKLQANSQVLKNRDWADAPEFVPKVKKSYADALKPEEYFRAASSRKYALDDRLCPYFEVGDCPEGDGCYFVHGEICELCNKACLFPFDNEQQRRHLDLCERELEKDMELSFAVQRSVDKTCGICMDVIMEKEGLSNRRFGILEKCNHVFCLPCIRRWRQVKRTEAQNVENMMDPGITRACPECRVASDFITPSQYWVDNEDEKKKLIDDYKSAMHKKPCKYFDEGRGTCPFAGACFYRHAYPDGRIAELPPPKPRRRRNQNGELSLMDHVLLYDFLELRDGNYVLPVNFEDIFYGFSDSDDSDSADYLDMT